MQDNPAVFNYFTNHEISTKVIGFYIYIFGKHLWEIRAAVTVRVKTGQK